MSDKEQAVLGGDLRDNKIPMGGCEDEEVRVMAELDNIKRDIRRLDTELDGHEQENARTITELSVGLLNIGKQLDTQAQTLQGISDRVGHLEVKIDRYNNLRERMDQAEQFIDKMGTSYVPRAEYQGALNSVREYAKGKADAVTGKMTMLVWAIGIGFSATGGAIGFLAARVFGG